MDKLHIKLLALNVNFDGPSFDFFYVQENLCTKTSKSGTPVKVVILIRLFASSFEKTVADRHGHAAYKNKY